MAILGCRGVPARYGGFETFADHLSRGLVNAGVHVTVYAEGEDAEVSYEGVSVRHVRPIRLGAASAIAYDIQCLWHARKSFDVVYMLGYGAAFGCWIPKLWGTRVWINMDGLEWARSKWPPAIRAYLKWMERIMASVSDHVLADAQAIKDYYERSYPEGAPCTFIPYGSHGVEADKMTDRLARRGLCPDGYFLIVARIEPENHILEIIEAHQQWGGSYPLVVVGDHTAQNSYCQKIRRHRSPSVVFLGAIYDAVELAALRRGAAAYLHGHSVGGTNPSLLESMWYGSVVVAHDNVFNREVLGIEGRYFESSSTLTHAFETIRWMDPSTRSIIKLKGQSTVRERYTWPKVVEDYRSLLAKELTLGSIQASPS